MAQRSIEIAKAAHLFVYYEGHLSSYPRVMVGKLAINSRYVVFHIHEPRYAGLFETARLVSTGRILSFQLDKILDVQVESGRRSRRSRPNWKSRDDFEKKMSGERAINAHPGFLDDSEQYATVTLTVETEAGVEVASFEVQDPHGWEKSLRAQIPKGAS